MVEIRTQSEFPLLDKYKEKFNVTDKTVFAYDGNIYTNYKLPKHLLIHESVHLKQQEEMGVDKWVELYLASPEFRAMQEVEAYVVELQSIKDRNQRLKHRIFCAKTLSSDLYGNILDYQTAYKLLA